MKKINTVVGYVLEASGFLCVGPGAVTAETDLTGPVDPLLWRTQGKPQPGEGPPNRMEGDEVCATFLLEG